MFFYACIQAQHIGTRCLTTAAPWHVLLMYNETCRGKLFVCNGQTAISRPCQQPGRRHAHAFASALVTATLCQSIRVVDLLCDLCTDHLQAALARKFIAKTGKGHEKSPDARFHKLGEQQSLADPAGRALLGTRHSQKVFQSREIRCISQAAKYIIGLEGKKMGKRKRENEER